MLHNVDITYKGNGRALAGQPKPSGLILLFADHLIFRPSDLFWVCDGTITGASLSAFLHTLRAGRSPGEGVCFNFLARVHCLLGPLRALPIEPVPTFQYYGAFHDRVFDTYELQELSVSRICSLIVKHDNPALPLSRLGLDETPPVVICSRDLKKEKHFIPVDADLLFRLQHNALFLGYRLQHFPSATTVCHHGCGVLEAAPHLF